MFISFCSVAFDKKLVTRLDVIGCWDVSFFPPLVLGRLDGWRCGGAERWTGGVGELVEGAEDDVANPEVWGVEGGDAEEEEEKCNGESDDEDSDKDASSAESKWNSSSKTLFETFWYWAFWISFFWFFSLVSSKNSDKSQSPSSGSPTRLVSLIGMKLTGSLLMVGWMYWYQSAQPCRFIRNCRWGEKFGPRSAL